MVHTDREKMRERKNRTTNWTTSMSMCHVGKKSGIGLTSLRVLNIYSNDTVSPLFSSHILWKVTGNFEDKTVPNGTRRLKIVRFVLSGGSSYDCRILSCLSVFSRPSLSIGNTPVVIYWTFLWCEWCKNLK